MSGAKTMKITTAAVALALATNAGAADLRVEVHGVSSAGGKVYAAVFKRAEDFPKADKAAAGVAVSAVAPNVSLVFPGLAAGDYAVSVYHDENGNGRLDNNLMGVPTEPYGFSRDAAGMMGPPKFADAAIKVDAADLAIKINLR